MTWTVWHRVIFLGLCAILGLEALTPVPPMTAHLPSAVMRWIEANTGSLSTDAKKHILGFCVLSISGVMAWRDTRLVILALLAMAVGLEVGQALVPRRDPGWADLGASLAGVVAGLGIGYGILGMVRPRRAP